VSATQNIGSDTPGAPSVIRGTITRQLTAAQVGISGFKLPYACDVLAVYAWIRTHAGAAPTFDVKAGGTSVLTGAITGVDGASTKGTVKAAGTDGIAAETQFTVDVASVGTSVDDISYEIVVRVHI
jgi:hypothetical protein